MSKWKLYWVASDGFEDCFVVAKNSRSAKRIEKEMNGFEDDDVTVIKVMDVPDKYEKIANKKFRDWSKKNNYNTHTDINMLNAWPYYADEWLLKELGAEFRIIEEKKETLIDDVVYAPGVVYPIGKKAMKELYEIDSDKKLDITNVSYEGIDDVISTMIGKSMVLVHKLEDYITNSFIFAVGNKKYSDFAISEVTKYWKKNLTFGKLINLMKENYDIDEDFEDSLQLFLQQRNKIAHGLTKEERYDIDTLWGKKEIVGFLALFLKNAFALEPVIESAYITSIGLGYFIMEKESKTIPKELKEEIKNFYDDPYVVNELEVFNEMFRLK